MSHKPNRKSHRETRQTGVVCLLNRFPSFWSHCWPTDQFFLLFRTISFECQTLDPPGSASSLQGFRACATKSGKKPYFSLWHHFFKKNVSFIWTPWLYVHLCTICMHQILWNCTYQQLWLEPRSSGQVASALNLWAISPSYPRTQYLEMTDDWDTVSRRNLLQLYCNSGMPQLRGKITMHLICTLAYNESEAKIFKAIPPPTHGCCAVFGFFGKYLWYSLSYKMPSA